MAGELNQGKQTYRGQLLELPPLLWKENRVSCLRYRMESLFTLIQSISCAIMNGFLYLLHNYCDKLSKQREALYIHKHMYINIYTMHMYSYIYLYIYTHIAIYTSILIIIHIVYKLYVHILHVLHTAYIYTYVHAYMYMHIHTLCICVCMCLPS